VKVTGCDLLTSRDEKIAIKTRSGEPGADSARSQRTAGSLKAARHAPHRQYRGVTPRGWGEQCMFCAPRYERRDVM
jgi:hypothetical protein